MRRVKLAWNVVEITPERQQREARARARAHSSAVVDELADLRRRVLDAGGELAPVGVGDLAVGGQHLGEAGDDRQRRAQVMAQPAARLRVQDEVVVAHGARGRRR